MENLRKSALEHETQTDGIAAQSFGIAAWFNKSQGLS